MVAGSMERKARANPSFASRAVFSFSDQVAGTHLRDRRKGSRRGKKRGKNGNLHGCFVGMGLDLINGDDNLA